ncbi:uncharacterized protein RCO7_00273 [Rhynchosporium graminicola]|uniref:2EXR domain-containing protein n=1 Tax=Rhynchosporium graminicola TaxID=2792576 RepID=A0A1E1KH21_9HELO|nr:uncharacterized protein RCO7_00273 [Rhynchosporium commune]
MAVSHSQLFLPRQVCIFVFAFVVPLRSKERADATALENVASPRASTSIPFNHHNTAAEVEELMANVEGSVRRRPSQSPNPTTWRELYRHLTTTLRKTLVDNIDIAEYIGMPTSQESFTRFARLPAEVHGRIWRFALPGPRIVELEGRWLENLKGDLSWQYIPKNPPPMPQTFRESYTVSRRVYRNNKPRDKHNNVASTPWIRYDFDIVHIRDVEFSAVEHGYAEYVEARARYTNGDEYSFDGRPDCFNHIEALAISREVLRRSIHRNAYLIRHFFPKLRVLEAYEGSIDESVDDYESESENGLGYEGTGTGIKNDKVRRDAFVANCMGPFCQVSDFNGDYASEIQSQLVNALEDESMMREVINLDHAPEAEDYVSDAESVTSFVSSLPSSNQQVEKASEDFYDIVNHVNMNRRKRMEAIVNTSAQAPVHTPAHEYVEVAHSVQNSDASDSDADDTEYLFAEDGTTQDDALSHFCRPSIEAHSEAPAFKRQKKHDQRRANAKEKKGLEPGIKHVSEQRPLSKV